MAGAYTIGYDYNLAGEVRTLTYYNGASVSYGYDNAGRTLSVGGSLFSDVTQYASDMKYRASNSLKSLTYGNGATLENGYNARLQLQRYHVTSVWGDYKLVDFEYSPDGKPRTIHDRVDPRFTRGYNFDQAGRLNESYNGGYDQIYQYNAFGDITNRDNWFWSGPMSRFTANYVNGRSQNSQWQYDAQGNVRFDNDVEYRYDASGENTSVRELVGNVTVSQTVDADEEMVKRVRTAPFDNETTYYLRSTVLDGKILTELNASAQPLKHYAYLDGEVLVTILPTVAGGFGWHHEVPITGSRGQSGSAGYSAISEPDSMGVDVGFTDPYSGPPEEPHDPDLASLYPGLEFAGRCRLEGIRFDCALAKRLLSSELATRCPNDNCNLSWTRDGWEDPFGQRLNQAPKRNPPTLSRGTKKRSRRVATATRPRRTRGTPRGEEQPLGGRASGSARIRDLNPILNRISWIDSGQGYAVEKPEFKAKIQDRITNMLTRACAEAFRRASLPTPEEIINRGLTIAARPLLNEPAYNETFGITEEARQFFNQSTAPVQTIMPQYTSKGAIMFFRGDAFTDLAYLDENIAHEFVHGAGEGPHPWLRGWWGHDLSGYEYYDDIIENCGYQNVRR